jgi:formamidopyrimidine-DNA glycosylase
MPELVDVEIVRRHLLRWTRGAAIVDVDARDRRILRPGSPAGFRRALVGRRVRGVSRRGKWLRIELDAGLRVFSHLGMTGDWMQRDPHAAAEPSERARLILRRGRASTSVRYCDARRFGRLVVAHDDIDEWRELGPDPLNDGLDAESLAASLAKSRRALKEHRPRRSNDGALPAVPAPPALKLTRTGARRSDRAPTPCAPGKARRRSPRSR